MTYYDLNMNSKRINNTQDPASAQDVATKNYVDGLAPTPTYLRGRLTSNQDMPSEAVTVIQFNTIDASANITWNPATWTGTIITTGYYVVGAEIYIAGTINDRVLTEIFGFYVNGSNNNGKGFFYQNNDEEFQNEPPGAQGAQGAR